MKNLTRWLLLLTLISLWGVGFILDRIAEEALLESVHDRLVVALHAHQRHLLTILADQQRGLRLFSAGAVQLLAQGKVPALDGRYLSTHLTEAIGCLLLDAQGRLVTHTAAPGPPPFEIVGTIPAGLPTARVTDPISDPRNLSGGSVYDIWLPLVPLDGSQIGTLACRVKNTLSQVLAEHRQGLALSGEVYLVSAKTRLMLTESRFLPNAVGRVTVDTIGVREALKMRNGIAPYPDYRGITVIGTFLYLRDYDWVLLAEMDEVEALAPLMRLRFSIAVSLILVSLAAGMMAWRFGHQLTEANRSLGEARVTAEVAQSRLEVLVNTAGDAVFEIDETSTILLANEAAHRMFGWPSGALVGQKVTVLMPPEERGKHEAGLRRYLETGESRLIGNVVEVTGYRRDGTLVPCELSLAAMTLLDGTRRFVGIQRDITKRKQMEEALRINEERLQLQIDRMPIGCIMWDPEFRIVTWNPAAEQMFGFTADEAMGKRPYDLIVPKGVQPHVDTIWRHLLEGDATAHSINENTTKDGRRILCDWANTPLKRPNGTVTGVLSMVQDITERARAEAEVQKAHQALQATARELQGRVDELERFRKATIQREFRIKELKDEIERLRGKP